MSSVRLCFQSPKNLHRHRRFIVLMAIAIVLLIPIAGIASNQVTLSLSLGANSADGIEGYRIYYKKGSPGAPYDGSGLNPGNSPVDIPLSNSAGPDEVTFDGLVAGETYYFVAKVFDFYGNESAYSNEVAYTAEEEAPLILTFNITASASGSGTISPAGATSVQEGDSLTYMISADQNHHIADVLVDGFSTGARSSYTFNEIGADHSIEAIFMPDEDGTSPDPDTGDTEPPTDPTLPGVDVISKDAWQLVSVDSEELLGEDGAAVNAFDGNPDTFWHTQWANGSPTHPHELVIDLGATYSLAGFSMLPRQDGSPNGRIIDYEFYVGNHPDQWSDPVLMDSFADNADEKSVSFPLTTGRYIRLVALSASNWGPWTSVAEIGVAGMVPVEEPPVIVTFNMTASADGNGSISPAGTTTVQEGETLTYTISADQSHHIADVLVDGVSVGVRSSYTFSEISTDHVIEAIFMADIMTYHLTASASGDGSISPAGTTAVQEGESLTYTIWASPDHHIADVLVDGVSVGIRSSYTFNGIGADHVIEALFLADENDTTPDPDTGDTAPPIDPTPPGVDAISKDAWQLVSVDSEELYGEDGAAVNAFDDNPDTIWHTQWAYGSPIHPHELVIDLGDTYNLAGFSMLPRQDGSANGRIIDYEFYVGNDPDQWFDPVATGSFADDADEKSVSFPFTAGRYIRLVAFSSSNGGPWTSVAEISLTGIER